MPPSYHPLMTRYPYAHTSGDNWLDLCTRALDQLGPIPQDAALGFIYVSDRLAAEAGEIVDWLRHHTKVPHWVGSVGSGICSTGLEIYDTPALALMVTDVAEDSLLVVPSTTDDFAGFLEASGSWRATQQAGFAIIHGDPTNVATPALIEQLADGLEGGFLVGGLTSSGGDQVQLADNVESGGVSGVLLSSNVTVATGLTQGCTLIGKAHTITACQDNVIVGIDERPALDVFREDIGEVLARNLEAVSGYIFAALPVPHSDTGDYLVRNLLGIDPDQGLLAIGDRVQAGQSIQFAKRDAETAREDLTAMIESLKKRLPGPAKGALYHSCLGRGRYQFGDDSAELRLIQEELGDVPLVGFYANGEISHRRLYGYTGVLTVFC